MIWHLLITILMLDFLYRICRYGKWEVQQFRNQLNLIYRGKKMNEHYNSSSGSGTITVQAGICIETINSGASMFPNTVWLKSGMTNESQSKQDKEK